MKKQKIKDLAKNFLEKQLLEICNDSYPASDGKGRRSHLVRREIDLKRSAGVFTLRIFINELSEHVFSEELTLEDVKRQIRQESTHFDESSGFAFYSPRAMAFIENEGISTEFSSDVLNPNYKEISP